MSQTLFIVLSVLLVEVVSRPRHLRRRKEICCGATDAAYNAMARISHQFAYELIGEHVRHSGPVDLALSPYSIISVLQVSVWAHLAAPSCLSFKLLLFVELVHEIELYC